MKELNVMQMEEINGGGNVGYCMAALVGGIGIVALSGVTGGLGLFLGGMFGEAAAGLLAACLLS